MADKQGLELIGAMLFAVTVFVIGAGGVVVRHQLSAEPQRVEGVELAQLPAHLPAVAGALAPHLVK